MDDVFASIDKEIAAIRHESYAEQTSSGVLMGSQLGIDHAEAMRNQRIQSAIWSLMEVRRIKGDPVLMAEVTAFIHDKRHEFMLLLDDLGGK